MVELQLVLELLLYLTDLSSSVINPVNQIITPLGCLQERKDEVQYCLLSSHITVDNACESKRTLNS